MEIFYKIRMLIDEVNNFENMNYEFGDEGSTKYKTNKL